MEKYGAKKLLRNKSVHNDKTVDEPAGNLRGSGVTYFFNNKGHGRR